jgi:predicted SAM-dependent methyltransferase
MSIPEVRLAKVFAGIDKAGLGLEIGPSFNPIAPKRNGFNCEVLDHIPTAELREKYRSHGLDISLVEEVDYVWNGEELPQLIGKASCYDYIIASHVIEHTPDMVGFLSQCGELLKPGGVLSLVVPDKRYCFDHFRPISTTGQLLNAHIDKRTKHSLGTIFDHFSLESSRGGALSWDSSSTGDFTAGHPFDLAIKIFEESKLNPAYIDVHNWCFTPASFELVIRDLIQMKLIDFGVESQFGTVGFEFFVSLRKGMISNDEYGPQRLQILKQIGFEICER